MISFIIPSYNNLKHLKNVYNSIKKHEPEAEIILLDDNSTDGTWEWVQQQDCIKYKSKERVGHTILYDKGIEIATNDIVGILHADMIIGPNYVSNLLKHLKPKTVVCATRIEPPIHPEGKEKIIRNFGMDFDSLNIKAFESFVTQAQTEFKDQTTKGIFAPWVLYKNDFQVMGGHDPLFAPYGYEDSDIFNRWVLQGYEMIQSRDAFVYHLTCRGHRWTKGVGVDNDDYKSTMHYKARNYIRKWGSWVKNDEYQHPIIPPKYDIGFVVDNCTAQLLEFLEPWCSTLYIKDEMGSIVSNYIKTEQPNTPFNLQERIQIYGNRKPNDILISFDGSKLTQPSFGLLQQMPDIIKDNGEPGTFELDIFTITIIRINELQNTLIKL
jgi:glycosyltransferase involved in cell wall biosynthesis